jgi:predicted acylesterase/phospholipase RssA
VVDAAVASPSVPAVVEPSPPGELGVSTMPWGHLYIDGRYIGDTPVAAVPVDAGAHVVRIVRPGFRPLERSLVVRPGERIRLTDLQLVRVLP